jgi:hypothetical protein
LALSSPFEHLGMPDDLKQDNDELRTQLSQLKIKI